MDVNRYRDDMIAANGLYAVDGKFTFYYDETNNIRRFYLTDDGTNVTEHKNFVLGGIVLAEGRQLEDIGPLRDALQIQKSAAEIKFAHVAKGNFEAALSSRKLSTFLSWLLHQGIGIHYSNLNVLYWAVVDIVDSIVANPRFRPYLFLHRELKNELHRIASLDLGRFLRLLKRYGYPNVKSEKAAEFIGEIEFFLAEYIDEDAHLPASMLQKLIEKASSLQELAFLMGKEDVLIESFRDFYIRPVALFKNSTHIFDHEAEIQKALAGLELVDAGRAVDYSFSNSSSEPGIQLSDVLVGLLGKYFTFIEENSMASLLEKKRLLNPIQSQNLGLLKQLIDISHDASNAFFHKTTAMDSEWKNDTFLHDLDPPPHLC